MSQEHIHLLNNAHMVYIEYESFSDQWHSILHSHPFLELFYVTKGSGFLKFNRLESIRIKENDLIIVNPNVFHTEYCLEDESMEYYVIGIENINLDLKGQDPRYSRYNFKSDREEIDTFLQLLYKESLHAERYHNDIQKRLLDLLLINILRGTKSNLKLSHSSSSANKDCLFIESFINENSHLDITLDMLSELTFLDKYYLSHLFKEYSKMAPIEYLHFVRLEKAKKLLVTSDFEISHISSMLGFANAAYFSQFFKKKIGSSPTKYRRENTIK